MSQEDEFELADRLSVMDASDPERGGRRSAAPTLRRVLGPLLMAGVVGGAIALAVVAQRDQEDALATAEPDDWQGTGNGFEAMPAPARAATPEPTPAAVRPSDPPVEEATGPTDSERAMMQTLAELRAELEAMREAAAQPSGPQPDDDASIERLSAQVAELATQSATMQRTLEDAQREAQQERLRAEGLQAELQAAQFADGIPPAPPLAGDGEAARLAALEERRAAAAALREARIESPMIAFGGSAAPQTGASAGGPSGLGPNEDFLRQGARAVAVEQATVIANPSRTVIQGTVIQAALETAVVSDLPGAIRAVVSEDVHSFDGTRVLIPRGSKLLGRYNSQIAPTQRRLMVAWDRILTPDGQSVTIGAYGADELGRSGTTGRIDRRLGTRFGSAALVSLISALPAAAAASVEDPLASELAEELGGDAEDASRSVLDGYLAVPPTLFIDQGARITVLVDRDLELLG